MDNRKTWIGKLSLMGWFASQKLTLPGPYLVHLGTVLGRHRYEGFRRGSTPVSTVLRKSVRFFIINTFLIIKNTFQVETWAICYLSDSKTQERGLKELNTKTFLGKPAPQTPLDSACAFGPRLENWSVFIPDPRLDFFLFLFLTTIDRCFKDGVVA